MRIGILALQGDFIEHQNLLTSLGVNAVLVKEVKDLQGLKGLIIPGGESSSMRILGRRRHLWHSLKEVIDKGLPVFGTCAGLVLLSSKIEEEESPTLNAIDVVVKRNAYGRQNESWEEELEVKLPKKLKVKAVFIRAPKIIKIGQQVEVLAEYSGTPVLVRENNVLAASFHPELVGDKVIHTYFLDMVKKAGG